MQIDVTFLGTGTSQGVPMVGCECHVCRSVDKRDHRLRSSVLIQTDQATIVIDTTPDFRYQMLRAGVKRLDAVLYTHEHKDHTGGMDDLRAFNYLMNKPMDVYCEPRVETVLRKDYDYAFAEFRYPGVPEINIHRIGVEPFTINNLRIIPIRGVHYKLPVLGFRIGELCYLTDMNAIADSEIEKFKGIDILIINALRHKEHISHFNLAQALTIIKKAQPRMSYLTHISHQMGLYNDITAQLPDNVQPAIDGMTIKLITL